ncbi:30S ribosomal protein S3 [uncultured Campylobacter sp.]|uniref:30S ribosomal protein S3 n=1 Tax=uncultured Campylobacter sp. TaxID=218934 RepID=UPI00260D3410|nr:30S ribosomal protein S3 [uncultured Campylobacter sp.]
MGQKVSPHGLRVGINKNWDSRWFASKDKIAQYIKEDDKVRKFLTNKLAQADLSKVEIERVGDKLTLHIFTAKPGMVIGKGGQGIEELKLDVQKLTGKNVFVNIEEIKNPDADANLVAAKIAAALEKRIAFRRAMKKVIQGAQKSGAKGIKISVAGRLGGAEMARTEWYLEGRVPLHTLRAKIDYGVAEAHTTYGNIGIKVWIFKGEVLQKGVQPEKTEEEAPKKTRRARRGK